MFKKSYIRKNFGDVAQLARVLDWQSRGRGFEPHLLHKNPVLAEFFCFKILQKRPIQIKQNRILQDRLGRVFLNFRPVPLKL